MLDIKLVRENPDKIKSALLARQLPNELSKIDELLALDQRRRALVSQSDSLKAKRNKVSDDIARLKRNKENADALIAEMKIVSDDIAALDAELRDLEAKQEELLLHLPNLLHESVPLGKDASENVVCKEVLRHQRDFDFKPKNHLELGKALDILDFERGAKITGAGFPVYKGKGATLERALINFMLDTHLAKGYEEIFPPFFVNRESLRGTGQFPKFIGQVYRASYEGQETYEADTVGRLFAIPTAEVPVTNLHRDEILKGSQLPIKYVAYSACFRSEAGSYGKDVRGFLRVHQFNKVELVKFATPETSYDELESLVADAESILVALGLPYRVVLLCSGDIGANAAKCYDLEVWSPAEQRFLEVSSCSNFEDFQARRANIRFKRDEKSKPEFVHTLNGSGLATSRLMVALLENYQTKDGKIIVPEVLRPYARFDAIG
ncbi:MAG: serine--tRNA ligase [Chloroherpetonaceae bacterium]|nr:serine--tRNA ligase [Chloroherpetonaceae bacterium]MDW8438740.1 serine--tRNA ligase [Chloroherpetonaceae bacterium]